MMTNTIAGKISAYLFFIALSASACGGGFENPCPPGNLPSLQEDTEATETCGVVAEQVCGEEGVAMFNNAREGACNAQIQGEAIAEADAIQLRGEGGLNFDAVTDKGNRYICAFECNPQQSEPQPEPVEEPQPQPEPNPQPEPEECNVDTSDELGPSGITFALVAGGNTFVDGQNIELPPFWLSKKTMTKDQLDSCNNDSICQSDSCQQEPERPATCIRWQQARNLASWAGGDLPTRAQLLLAASRGDEGDSTDGVNNLASAPLWTSELAGAAAGASKAYICHSRNGCHLEDTDAVSSAIQIRAVKPVTCLQ